MLQVPVVWGCEQFADLVRCVDYVIDDTQLRNGGSLRWEIGVAKLGKIKNVTSTLSYSLFSTPDN